MLSKKVRPRKFIMATVSRNAIEESARIDLLERYKLTNVVLKLRNLVVDENALVPAHWLANLELLSVRIEAPATPLPLLSAATLSTIRSHQAQIRAERMIAEHELEQERESGVRACASGRARQRRHQRTRGRGGESGVRTCASGSAGRNCHPRKRDIGGE